MNKISGTSGTDYIQGTQGNDEIRGNGGIDCYQLYQSWGQAPDGDYDGSYYVVERAGGLYGLAGNDVIYGGDSRDALYGGAGNDVLYGGAGSDSIEEDGGRFEQYLLRGGLHGGAGNDRLHGEGGNDQIYGDDGDDVLVGGEGLDTLVGGKGNDTYFVDAYRSVTDVVVELKGQGYDRIFSSVSFILGESDFIEELHATGSSAISLTGNRFNNVLVGNSANNTLIGGAGNDTLKARGDSSDRLVGGIGDDTYYVHNGSDAVIELQKEGRDTLIALVDYQLADDAYFEVLKVGHADIRLVGNRLANTLIGGEFRDTLIGGAGNDRLEGGFGGDLLRGGAGRDTFVFSSPRETLLIQRGRDIIFDFNRSERDKIDLQEIDANSTVGGNQSFKFIGAEAFSGSAGELKYVSKETYLFVYGDLDGDQYADFSLLVNDLGSLLSRDFIL